ncbi:MAG: hypothetical protein ACXWVI_03565 [Methyloceanibacter sp.]
MAPSPDDARKRRGGEEGRKPRQGEGQNGSRASQAAAARSRADRREQRAASRRRGNRGFAQTPGTSPQSAAPAPQQQQITISTSSGFIDCLATNHLSLALTSYQTGQLMLIGPLLDGRLSAFQRNFVRAMGSRRARRRCIFRPS